MSLDIKIQFYCKPKPYSYERFHKPTSEECEVINKFQKYNPVIDAKNPAPSLNHLQGFYWKFGDEELSECANHICEPAFLVIYFQNPIDQKEYEGFKKAFSDLLGLESRGVKLKPEIPTKEPQDPFKASEYVSFDGTRFIDGIEYNVTTIKETPVLSNQERINELIAILRDNDQHLIEPDNTVP